MNIKATTYSIAFAGLLASGLASAATFPLFSLSQNLSGTPDIVDANKLVGAYNEVTTINTFDPVTGTGTFSSSLLWRMSQIQNVDNGNDWLVTNRVYALFQGNGTISTSGSTTLFNFTAGDGLGLSVYWDQGNNTQFSLPAAQPLTGSSYYTPTAGGAGDLLLATGAVLGGNGTQTCLGFNNCGSYGVSTAFNLTADGLKYFVDPVPFYTMQISTGQFNGVPLIAGRTSVLNGSQDVVFISVPEPASIALVGIGLLGFGLRSRKKV